MAPFEHERSTRSSRYTIRSIGARGSSETRYIYVYMHKYIYACIYAYANKYMYVYMYT